MKSNMFLVALAVSFTAAVVFSGAVSAAEDGPNPYTKILEEKAPSVVCVKFVLKVTLPPMLGGSREMNREAPGVMVDPVGLVMISSSHMESGGLPFRMGGALPKPKASKFMVVFPGEDKEYDAILGAVDSKLNLAFIRIKDLKERKVSFVDFNAGGKAKVGQELIGVDRLGKGFDYAPFFNRVLVTGEVKQPRPMFAVTAGLSAQGLPLFDKEGKPVGVLATQSGAEGTDEGGGISIGGMSISLPGGMGNSAVFLIPAETVKTTVVQAKKQAEEALKKAAEKGDEDEEEGDEGEEDDEGDEDEGW